MAQTPNTRTGWLIRLAVVLSLTAAPALAESEAPDVRVSLRDGRLTVEAERAPLQTVLETIARHGGFTIEVRGEIAETVSPSIRALPVHAAIGALLEEGRHSFFLQYAERSPGQDAVRLARLVVIAASPDPAVGKRAGEEPSASPPAPGSAAPAAPVELDDAELQEAIEILEEMLQEEDLPLREAAAEALADLDDMTAAN